MNQSETYTDQVTKSARFTGSGAVLVMQQRLMAHALRELLLTQFHFENVYESNSVSALAEANLRPDPKLVLIATSLFENDGRLETWRLRRRFGRRTRVVALFDQPVRHQANVMNNPGLSAILDARLDCGRLYSALETVMAGGRIVDLLPAPQRSSVSEIERILPLIDNLRPRTREVFDLVTAGYSNVAMSERLGIAETTIKWHLNKILDGLGLRSRVQLAAIATRLEILVNSCRSLEIQAGRQGRARPHR